MHIELRQLTKAYNGRVVFRELSRRLEPGAVHLVTGPNGAGKSTLLKLICGLLRPTAGEVRMEVDGRTVAPGDRGRFIGLAAPDVNPYDRLSPYENLAFFAALRGLTHTRRETEGLLRRMRLEAYADRPVAFLSSGMRQRLRIALALLHAPPVLVLDEPAANLDEEGRQLVDEIIRAQYREGMVILATNEPGEVGKYGRRAIRLGASPGGAAPQGPDRGIPDQVCL